MHLTRSAVLVLALSLPVFATSPAPSPSPSPSPVLRDEMIVTAAAVPESLEDSPAAVTVVTKEEIARREVRDVADVLRQVPGVVVSRSGSPGKVASVFTRGGNSTHTLVLWNGIEINNPYFSGYDWGRFSVAGVDRVEVVRGPYSALYGSEAVSGVINVITDTATGRHGSVDVQSGQRGLFNGSVSGSAVAGPLRGSGSFERRTDHGFARNDDFAQDSALGSIDWSPTSSLSLGIRGRYTRYDLGVPFTPNADLTAFVPSPDRRQSGHESQLALPLRLRAGGTDYELTVSRSDRSDDFADPQDPFFFTSSSTTSATSRARFTASRTSPLGRITAGAEYEHSSVDDSSSFGVNLQDDTRSARSFFAEDRVSFAAGTAGRLEIAAGARYDRFDTFGSELSPRLAAAWIEGANKLRAAYGRSFRAPSIGELYFPFYGNEQLRAERGNSVELGYDRFLGPWGIASATVFRSDFDNLIVYDNSTFRFENTGAANTSGVELGLSTPFGDHWSTNVTYTRLRTEQQDTGEALLRRPRNSGSASLSWFAGAWSATGTVLYNGQRLDVTDLAPFGHVSNASYTVANLVVRYSIGELAPYLRIENLADARYQEVFGYPSPGRRVIAGIRWQR